MIAARRAGVPLTAVCGLALDRRMGAHLDGVSKLARRSSYRRCRARGLQLAHTGAAAGRREILITRAAGTKMVTVVSDRQCSTWPRPASGPSGRAHRVVGDIRGPAVDPAETQDDARCATSIAFLVFCSTSRMVWPPALMRSSSLKTWQWPRERPTEVVDEQDFGRCGTAIATPAIAVRHWTCCPPACCGVP